MDKRVFDSYEEVHAKLVEAMQEACTKDESGTYSKPNVVPGYVYDKYSRKNKSSYRVSRFSKVAVILIVVLLGMNLVTLNSDTSEVYGDKGLLHRIFEGTRGIFTDKDESDIVEFDESNSDFTLKDIDKITEAKLFWPDLYIPKYIPKEYEFIVLNISKSVSGDYIAEYEYGYNKDVLEINITFLNTENKSYSINKGNFLEFGDRKVNLYRDDFSDKNIADVYFEDVTAHIYSSLEENELLNISKNLYK